MNKPRKQSLRKRNCLRIAQAFLPYYTPQPHSMDWLIRFIDPISPHNWEDTNKKCVQSDAYMKFWCQSTQVHVPLSWYWREIDDWEIESLVTEWKLSREY